MDFALIKAIAAEIKHAALLFSCGKDSIVCFDLCVKYGIKITPIYFYMIPDLKIRNDIIQHYENRYNIKVIQAPHPNMLDFIRDGKKVNFGNAEKYARKVTDEYWLLSGMKQKDSFFRRGMLKAAENGIDHREKKLYPLRNWSDKDVMHYINQNKLPLPVDYRYGVTHEFNKPTVEFINFLHTNFPDDYERTMKAFPFLKIKMEHEAMYGR